MGNLTKIDIPGKLSKQTSRFSQNTRTTFAFRQIINLLWLSVLPAEVGGGGPVVAGCVGPLRLTEVAEADDLAEEAELDPDPDEDPEDPDLVEAPDRVEPPDLLEAPDRVEPPDLVEAPDLVDAPDLVEAPDFEEAFDLAEEAGEYS